LHDVAHPPVSTTSKPTRSSRSEWGPAVHSAR
jgi:hypothetical protein